MILAGFHSTFTIPLIASLTENLDDISLRYNTTSSRPEWKERGADTWNPFSGTLNFVYISHSGGTVLGAVIYANEDGTYNVDTTQMTDRTVIANKIMQSDIVSSAVWNASGYYNLTIAKTGYYLLVQGVNSQMGGIVHYNSGNVVSTISYGVCTCLTYLGETNPFA